jgi:hypothetical protein
MYAQELQRARDRMSLKRALAELQQRQEALNIEKSRIKLQAQQIDEQERAKREIQRRAQQREREAQRQVSEAESGKTPTKTGPARAPAVGRTTKLVQPTMEGDIMPSGAQVYQEPGSEVYRRRSALEAAMGGVGAPGGLSETGIAGEPGQPGAPDGGDQFFGTGGAGGAGPETELMRRATAPTLATRPAPALPAGEQFDAGMPATTFARQAPTSAASPGFSPAAVGQEPLPVTLGRPFRDPYAGVNAAAEAEGRERSDRLLGRTGLGKTRADLAEAELQARIAGIKGERPYPKVGTAGLMPDVTERQYAGMSFPEQIEQTQRLIKWLETHGYRGSRRLEDARRRLRELQATPGASAAPTAPESGSYGKAPPIYGRVPASLREGAQIITAKRRKAAAPQAKPTGPTAQPGAYQMRRYERLLDAQRRVPPDTSAGKALPGKIAKAKTAAVAAWNGGFTKRYDGIVHKFRKPPAKGAQGIDRRTQAEMDLLDVFVAQRTGARGSDPSIQGDMNVLAEREYAAALRKLGPTPPASARDLSPDGAIALEGELALMKTPADLEAKKADLLFRFLKRAMDLKTREAQRDYFIVKSMLSAPLSEAIPGQPEAWQHNLMTPPPPPEGK